MSISIKRAYEEPDSRDGYRVLVDRVWPRGVSKNDLDLDDWLKELAPSSELRKWFGHDPERWEEFRKRYHHELKQQKEAVQDLKNRAGKGMVTLVYGAKEERYNNARALKEYLDSDKD